MSILKKAISCFFMITLILFVPVNAYSMDTKYVNNTEIWWYDNDDIVHMPPQNLGKYEGVYSYYIDSDNNCFYLYISYYESDLKDKNNDIKMEFQISNSVNNYYFIVNENGMMNPDKSTKSAFNIALNFKEATKQGQDLYLGLEFCNKNDKILDNSISFSVIVNGKSYTLNEGLVLPFYKEKDTTKIGGKEKTTASKTNKKDSKTTTQRSTKNTTEKTTKFKYVASATGSGKYTADTDSPSEEYEYDEAENDVQILTEESVNSKEIFPLRSKVLIAVSAVILATGIGIAAYNLNKMRNAKKQEKSENE